MLVLAGAVFLQYKFHFVEEIADMFDPASSNASSGSSGSSFTASGSSSSSAPSNAKSVEAQKAIIMEFRKMNSLTDMGINYVTYGSKLADMKPTVEAQLGDVKNPRFKQIAEVALTCYVDAYTLWNWINQSGGYEVFMSDTQAERFEKYSALFTINRDERGQKWLNKRAIKSIWTAAGAFSEELEKIQER